MTVAAAVAAVAPAGRDEKHGSYVDADEEYHHRETIAAVAAAAAASHRREISAAAAAAAAACHRREISVAAAAAAVACHRREVPYRRPFLGLRLPRPPSPKPRPTTRACGFGGSAGAPAAGPCFAISWALRWEYAERMVFSSLGRVSWGSARVIVFTTS